MTASIDDFCVDGFLVARGAVAPGVVGACVDVIENEVRARGIEPRDPGTWTEPVVRFPCPDGPAFTVAGKSAALVGMYDALLGAGRWIQREGVGGTLPIRFPSTSDPGDAGWHIDGSYDVEGRWWVNVHSRRRGLLALFLFTDLEDPRLVHRAIAGFAGATGIGCSALSLYLWDVSPLAVWALMMAGVGAASLIVTGMFAVTVWPVVLLIAKVFDRRGAGKVGGAGPAEPGAAAEGDRDESAK